MVRHSYVSRSSRSAFTLIELLVVISIIALLISILVPSLSEAKWMAKVASCSNNLHGVGVASAQYSSVYELDTPWIYFDGTGDGIHESSWGAGNPPGTPRPGWAGKTPGNPAEALLMPGFTQLLEGPEFLFCPTSMLTVETNYNIWAAGAGQQFRWGTYRYVYPHLPYDEDPFYTSNTKDENRMCHVNNRDWVGANSKNLVMHDSDTEYPHFNGLMLGGSVETIARGGNMDAVDVYLYGEGKIWYNND